MEIIILDSGVCRKHPKFRNTKIEGYALEYNEKKNECRKISEIEDHIGHGTAVYDIIRQNTSDVTVKMIKIFDNSIELSEEAFYAALLYVYENENPDILNLSLGLTYCENIPRLYKLCKNLYNRNVLIVSAFDNNGAISYPASFDCVYGVMGTSQISNVKEIGLVKNSCVNILAKGTTSKLAWNSPEYIFMSSNSFSCAFACAAICNLILQGRLSKEDIPITNEQLTVKRKPSFQIKKAAVFPFNKEMHSLIRFAHLLDFEIVDVYDHKLSGRVSSTTGRILNLKDSLDFQIKNIDNIEWDKFDTLILGHLEELSILVRNNTLKNALIDIALQKGKNIYSFDPCERLENIYFPEVTTEYVPKNHFGKLYKINKPVLGIFGTSSKQGKFSLQLTLRELLEKQDYYVGQLGTEPTSYLFGMDEIFPYGYSSTIKLSEEEVLIYLNRQMQSIASSDCDLILIGGQSAVISYDLNNTSQFIPYQNTFITATCPDTIVLTVSPQDTVEYIERTIKYLESVTEATVIAICLFPIKLTTISELDIMGRPLLLTKDELYYYQRHLEKSLNKKVYILGHENDMEELVKDIISFFSN